MEAKVIKESYQITYEVETEDEWKKVAENVEYKDAYWRAFQLAGTLRRRVSIKRLTTVELPETDDEFAFLDFDTNDDGTANVVTGCVVIDKEHFARDVSLSRYHSVNGWVIPEYVDLETVYLR